MKKAIGLTIVFAFALSLSPIYAQAPAQNAAPVGPKDAPKPTTAVLIKDAAVQAKLKDMIEKRQQDESIRLVSTGEGGNLGVFLIRLNPTPQPAEPVTLMSHNDVSEVYYVLKGEGIIYHGGTFEGATPRQTRPAGPGMGGPSKDKIMENVGPGDIFIITPNTPHQVNLGAKTEMLYLVVRVDPKKQLEIK